MRLRSLLLVIPAVLFPALLSAETCVTQSHLSTADRSAIAASAASIASAVQSNNPATLRSASDPDLQKNFGELQYMAAITSPRLAGGAPVVEQIYLLDASTVKPNPDGSLPEAQFFCSLNNSSSEADFVIPSLPAGRYAFVMVTVPSHPVPWRLSMLLVEQSGRWLLAGFYPKPLAVAGHDGLWYWTQARQFASRKELWDAWLFYQEAMTLLRPADFVLSTHLDKLHTEQTAATPPALSGGISPQTPLVLRPGNGSAARLQGRSGSASAGPSQASSAGPTATQTAPGTAEFRFTALSIAEPPTGSSGPALQATFEAAPLSDPAAARERNLAAAQTLLNGYPELRQPFTEVLITAESPGQLPLTTTIPFSAIH